MRHVSTKFSVSTLSAPRASHQLELCMCDPPPALPSPPLGWCCLLAAALSDAWADNNACCNRTIQPLWVLWRPAGDLPVGGLSDAKPSGMSSTAGCMPCATTAASRTAARVDLTAATACQPSHLLACCSSLISACTSHRAYCCPGCDCSVRALQRDRHIGTQTQGSCHHNVDDMYITVCNSCVQHIHSVSTLNCWDLILWLVPLSS